jgi:hypothetical protein
MWAFSCLILLRAGAVCPHVARLCGVLVGWAAKPWVVSQFEILYGSLNTYDLMCCFK